MPDGQPIYPQSPELNPNQNMPSQGTHPQPQPQAPQDINPYSQEASENLVSAPKASKFNLKMILIIVGGVIILTGLSFGGYYAFKYLSDPLRKFTFPAATDVQKSTLKKAVNESLAYDKVSPDPSKYKGEIVHWSGQVYKVEKGKGYTSWQMWADPANAKSPIVCFYPDSALDIKENDFFEVYGGLTKNFLNSKNKAPFLKIGIATEVDRNTVCAPTKDTWKINQTQSKFNFSVTLEKVELAENETRFYLKLKNSSVDKINFDTMSAQCKQGTSQIKIKSIYNDKQNELPMEILPSTEESGIIYFEKADPKTPLTLLLKASNLSTSDSKNFHKMDFTFKVKSK